MAEINPLLQGSAITKNLTPAQEEWLNGVIASMKQKINTQLEPDNNPRTPLEKALADDHALNHMDFYYNGAMQEARFMELGSSQMPNFYSLWVALQRAGPPLPKEQAPAYILSITRDEIPEGTQS
ncbi:hypothetical protein PTTG_09211 [Puccinia triticina 1-1 BBBD Race 1]|uniref:Uncharacterized protein n=1 Tax=Puccinia triticina (isolate 1-1 / race 1 (BBBD)) TaxID=630390 RepID=A0A180G836_PUCT1|nr:hypothetical protein PTTG_09211 [Puccinia triticina 1-1 BBBD Race 1]